VHVRRVLDDAHVALGARDPELSDGRRAVGEQPVLELGVGPRPRHDAGTLMRADPVLHDVE
jgi:hypothetical protein